MSLNMLPNEVFLKHVLLSPILSVVDICSLSQTCKFFNQIIVGNSEWIWETKFKQRWSRLANQLEIVGTGYWKAHVQSQYHIEHLIKSRIQTMAAELSISGQPSLDSMGILDSGISYEALEDAILKVAYDKEKLVSSFTDVYYAKYLLRYLRCAKFEGEIRHHLRYESEKVIKGAFLVSKWELMAEEYVPKWEEVSQTLKNLEIHVQRLLSEKKVTFSLRTHKQPNEEKEAHAIVTAILQTVFRDWNFKADTVPNSAKNNWFQLIQGYYIGEVLQKRIGKPIILAIIVQELMNRFNIKSELLHHGEQFCLQINIMEKPTQRNLGWLFLDLENLSILSHAPPNSIFSVVYQPVFYEIIYPLYQIAVNRDNENCISKEAWQSMSKQKLVHFELNFSRLACSWKPYLLPFSSYACACVRYGMHLYEAKRLLQNLSTTTNLVLDLHIRRQQNAFLEASIPKERSETILFAVGMCVRIESSTDDHNLVLCVITDWDEQCNREFYWQEVKLEHLNRPFYHVIKEDGDIAYISQGKIISVEPYPELIDDDKIGIHFKEFNGSYYVGNTRKQETYPEDEYFKDDFFQFLF